MRAMVVMAGFLMIFGALCGGFADEAPAGHFRGELAFLNQLTHVGNSRCADPEAEISEELVCQHFRDPATGVTYFLAYLGKEPWKVWRRDGESGVTVIWQTKTMCRRKVCV